MKSEHQENTTLNEQKMLSASQFCWALLSMWLVYSVVMLWHFKEQTSWVASMCKVAY